VNILIVDDHPMIHEVLGAVARVAFDQATVLSASSLEHAIQLAHAAGRIDLVLLDLGLPGCNGIEALTEFRRRFPQPKLVIVSATEDRASVLTALQAGACGYIPKTYTPPLIAAALRVVAEGGTHVPPQALREDGASGGLTVRQLDVLRLIAKGLGNKEIARRLRIARNTVKQHAKAVYSVLGIAERGQAARAAERHGIKLD
jgi:two-component system, NarL family, nitrate/nitrite response regulator NarL